MRDSSELTIREVILMAKKILISLLIIMIPVSSMMHWPYWSAIAFAIVALVCVFLPENER